MAQALPTSSPSAQERVRTMRIQKQRPPDSRCWRDHEELGGRALQGAPDARLRTREDPAQNSISQRDVPARQRETDCPFCGQPLRRPFGVCFAARPGIDGCLVAVEFLMHQKCARRAAIVYDHDALN